VVHVVDAPTGRRDASLDTLRTLLVAWIIVGHALLGYAAVGGWGYDEVNEVTFRPSVELVLAALLGPTALFLMGSFFLIAGLFSQPSLYKKGTRAFVVERVLRLGLPWLASAFVIWPMTMWVAYRSAGQRVSYEFLLVGRDRLIDAGSLWFAGVLLIFSLCYAVGHRVLSRRGQSGAPPVRGPLPLAAVISAAVVLAALTFVVRQFTSARDHDYFDLHLWQWPQLGVMFALGVLGARYGLARGVPERVGRVCGWVTLGAVITGPLTALALGVRDLSTDLEPFLGGWSAEAFALAVYESVLVVFGSLWLVRFAQRRLRRDTALRRQMARSSFAAFILQGPVLILIAVAMRPLPLPAEVKAPVLLVAGLAACFGLGWLLVTRTRVGRFV
jgi:uncharacterized membrane protein YidH (DUF202 family)